MDSKTKVLIGDLIVQEPTGFPPTLIYNEGWLLRLILNWFKNNPQVEHPLKIPKGVNHYSEALLSSKFLKKNETATPATKLAETYTRADGVIGHFKIGNKGNGDLHLDTQAQHFVVVEAKLKSGVSKGVTNAKNYSQITRTIACMLHNLTESQCAIQDFQSLGFVLIAPESKLSKLKKYTDQNYIIAQLLTRVEAYNCVEKNTWYEECLKNMFHHITIENLSWEAVIQFIGFHDKNSGQVFDGFYKKCLTHNHCH